MTDERLEELIGAWMKTSVATETDARESAKAILERLDGEDAGTRRPLWRGGTFAPYLRAAAAMALVVLVGAFLLLTLGPTDPTDPTERPQHVVIGASHEPAPTSDAADLADPVDAAGPAIHWQTDEVDLYAEGMTLRIGDQTYTGRDASFRVEASGGDGRRWVLSAAWEEAGQQHLLELDFTVDGDGWWISSVKHERPDVYGPDGTRYAGVTWFEDREEVITRFEGPDGGAPRVESREVRLPLAQADTADLRVSSTTRMPTCGPLVSNELEVTFELAGLRLAVHPKDPSLVEGLADRLIGPRSPVGRAVAPPPEPQARYVELECPEQEPIDVVLAGLELQAVPVGTGAWRVLGDGIHDLDESIVDVAVVPDGSTVVATTDRLLWLGSDAQPVSTTTHVPWPNRVDVTPSGDLLIRGGERQSRKNVMVRHDGDGFTELPRFSQSEERLSSSQDVYDPSWDAEGTLWVGVSGGVGVLADGTWEYRSRYEYSPLAVSLARASYGATRGVAAAPDGDIWIGSGPTFAQYHDGRWIEHDPLHDLVETLDASDAEQLSAKPLDLKIDDDGTMWALTRLVNVRRPAYATVLVRRIGDEWTVFPFELVTPDEGLSSQHIAVHDGSVLLLVDRSSREPGAEASEPRLLRFDGVSTTELARLPAGLGYRIADVGPDGTVWIVGGSAERHHADRIHLVPPPAEAVTANGIPAISPR